MATATLAAGDLSDACQDELRRQVAQIADAASLRALRTLNVRYTIGDALIIYLVLASAIAATWALHRQFGPMSLLAAPLLACVTGVAFNWINAQIHEASHNLLLPAKRWNDLYCNWVLGSLALQAVETYRATHGMHHSQLHTEHDPDLSIYTTRVGSLWEVGSGIFRDLSLLSALERVRHVARFFEQHPRLRPDIPLSVRCGQLAGQLLVLAVFVTTCGPWGTAYYAAVYVYGLVGVFPALIRLRTVVEHASGSSAQAAFTSRTTVPSFLQLFVVGARMDYHFEHHLYPNIPYYNLKSLHRTLARAGLFETLASSTGRRDFVTQDYVRSFGRLTYRREPEAC